MNKKQWCFREKCIVVISALTMVCVSGIALYSCKKLPDAEIVEGRQYTEKDALERFQEKNQSDLNKIKDYDLEEEKKLNGDYINTDDRNHSNQVESYQTQRADDGIANEVETKIKAANPMTADDIQMSSWLYYDKDSDEWGDAYYYTIKGDDGRLDYEYAYSMINGKKKVDDRMYGAKGQVAIVPEDYVVPPEIQKKADDEFITIIHMPDSEFEYTMEEASGMNGEVFTDPYERLQYMNDEDNIEKSRQEYNNIRTEIMSEGIPKIDSTYMENLNRIVENNDNASISQKATATTYQILDKYAKDYTGKGATEEENEEIDFIDSSYAELNVYNLMVWSNIGYKSELCVVRVNNLNKIVSRKDAFALIDEIYKAKMDILDKAIDIEDARLANAMTVSVPSAREFALQEYKMNKQENYMKKYKEVVEEIRNR